VGTFEFALLHALALYDVPAGTALGFAVGTHVFSTVFTVVLGLASMWLLRVRPGELFSIRRRAEANAAAAKPTG
jgi:uncharacterized membrane protein YbhN (UPF0104 family)